MYMYPRLTVYRVEISSTLRRFIEGLGEDILYAYDRRLVGVIVNGKPMWPSAELKPGDDVTIFPIMTGG
jgi:molybdopterin converting factor small subunit